MAEQGRAVRQIDIAVFCDLWPHYFIHDLPHEEVALHTRPTVPRSSGGARR